MHNAILIEQDDGSFKVLAGKRSDDMPAHPSKWSLIGGYIEIGSSHGIEETIQKEVGEETDGQLLTVHPDDYYPITTHVDYDDQHNGSCVSIGNVIILRGDRAAQANEFIEKGLGTNNEVSELKLFDLQHFAQQVEEEGGMAYPHELKTVIATSERIATRQAMDKAMVVWARDDGLQAQFKPDPLGKGFFISQEDPNKTISATEFLASYEKGLDEAASALDPEDITKTDQGQGLSR